MDAIAMLKEDHQKVKKLLKEGDESTERAVKTRQELIQTLQQELDVHERIEEEIFYPALQSFAKAKEIVLEAYEEHDVVDTILGEILTTPVDDETWAAKFTVMKENLEHHIEEEEGDMFKKARDLLSETDLEELGERMQQRKEMLLASVA